VRLRRPWPFQNWRHEDFGYGPVLVVCHSWLLRLFDRCKCMGCVTRRVGRP
jgi:hypothetical protein